MNQSNGRRRRWTWRKPNLRLNNWVKDRTINSTTCFLYTFLFFDSLCFSSHHFVFFSLFLFNREAQDVKWKETQQTRAGTCSLPVSLMILSFHESFLVVREKRETDTDREGGKEVWSLLRTREGWRRLHPFVSRGLRFIIKRVKSVCLPFIICILCVWKKRIELKANEVCTFVSFLSIHDSWVIFIEQGPDKRKKGLRDKSLLWWCWKTFIPAKKRNWEWRADKKKVDEWITQRQTQ